MALTALPQRAPRPPRLPPPVRDPVARLPRLAADPDRCRGGMSPRGREASIERARSKPQTYVLQSVEQRPQFVAKVRELSTKVHHVVTITTFSLLSRGFR